MRLFSLFLLFSLISIPLIGQDDCASATPLTLATECTLTTYNTTGLTSSAEPDPSCGVYQGPDMWFSFTVPADGQFAIQGEKIGSLAPVAAVYSGTCGALTEIDCSSNGSPFNAAAGLVYDDPSLGGQTLYLRMYFFNSSTTGDFNLCVFDTSAPENGTCADAQPVAITASVVFETYSNEYAAGSDEADGDCGFYSHGDIWFSFTSPADGQFMVTTSDTGPYSTVIEMFSGACGSLVHLGCSSGGSPNGNSGQLVYNDASLGGLQILIRVYSYANYNGGTFEMAVVDTDAPINDECTSPILLPVTASPSIVTYSNLYATDSEDEGNGSCGFYAGADVWFTFTAPADGQFLITSSDLVGEYSPVIDLYSGSCGALASIDCSAGGSQYGNSGRLIFNDASYGGQTLTLRVYSYANNDGGDFGISVVDVVAPANDFCADIISVPVTAGFDYTTYSNLYGTDSDDGNPGCGFYSGADVWFSFTAPANGQFVISTAETGDESPVISLYSGTCGALTNIDCSQGGSEIGNSGEIIINQAALGGQAFIIRLFSYATHHGGDFGLAVVDVSSPSNDFCVDAISVPVTADFNYTTYSNVFGTDSDDGNPGCGFYGGGDVWFSFTAPADGQFVVLTAETGPESPVIALYSGTCGSLTNIDCSQNGSEIGNSGQIIINEAALGGQTLLIRLYSYATNDGGQFGLAVVGVQSPENDFCENATPLEVAASCNLETYGNRFATNSPDGTPNNTCGFNSLGDVWFTTTVPSNGEFTIDTDDIGEYSPVISILTGTCGSLENYACDFGSSDNGFTGYLDIIDETLADQEVYIRVVSYAQVNGGAFDMCIYTCAYDLTGDDEINTADLIILIAAFGCDGTGCIDYTGDNKTDTADLVILLSNFGSSCN